MLCFCNVEPPLCDPLNIRELDLLGPFVPFRVRLHRVDLLVEVFWAVSSCSARLVLGLLGLVGQYLVKLLHSRFEQIEPAMHRPLPPQPHERLVTGQHVDAVQHERDVVEFQVLDLPPPQLEELLADQVEVGDRDRR